MALTDAPIQNVTPDPAAAPSAAPATTAPAAAPAAVPQNPAIAQEFGNAQTAYKQAADIANTPNIAPPVPHQRLLAMVAGLAQGLSAAGTALATRGEKGGAPQVAAYQQQQQEMRIQQQQAATAQKNAEIQQKLMVGDTNMKLANSVHLMSSWDDEAAQMHFKTLSDQQGLAKGAVDLQAQVQDTFDTKGYVPSGWTVDPNTGQVSQSGSGQPSANGAAPTSAAGAGGSSATAAAQPAGAPPTSGAAPTGAPSTTAAPTGTAAPVSSVFNTRLNMVLDAAGKELQDDKGNDDPLVTGARQILADSASSPVQKKQAVLAVQNKAGLSAEVIKNLTAKADLTSKQQATDPLFKFQSDPKALSDPGAQATLQAYIANPANKDNLNGIALAKTYIAKAGIAQQHDIDLAARKSSATKTAEQLVSSGTPQEQGQALYDGNLTLTDLKSRGSTPKQITDAQNAANNIAKAHGTTYNASDEIVGEKALGEIGNQTFYGSGRSLVQRGGMLDQLKAAHDALGNGKIPTFNKYSDWVKYQAGSPELATYRASVLGAADDYAKVIGGGTPSDSAREAAADQFIYQMNQGQFNGSVEQARAAVRSQVKGRIGTNRYVQQREGDITQEHQVGDTVTLRNGQQVVIKAINPDGTFN